MKLFIQVFIAVIPLIFSFSTSDPTLNIRFFSFSIFISLLLLYQIFKNSKVYLVDIDKNATIKISKSAITSDQSLIEKE